MCEDFIQALHKRLFGKVWRRAGRYRESDHQSGASPEKIEAELGALLDNAGFWAVNGVYPALEAAARFHLRLTQIRCFERGVGRHGRIATDIYLREYFRHPTIDWALGDDLAHNSQRRGAYLVALMAGDEGNISALMEFMRAE